MDKSISETLKKINIEASGGTFLSIVLTLILISSYLGYKIVTNEDFIKAEALTYIASNFSPELSSDSKTHHFIYASSRGTKYYYYNCKANIKEANKIFFDSEEAAKKAGYTLAKTCE